jgi:hypothetical protein
VAQTLNDHTLDPVPDAIMPETVVVLSALRGSAAARLPALRSPIRCSPMTAISAMPTWSWPMLIAVTAYGSEWALSCCSGCMLTHLVPCLGGPLIRFRRFRSAIEPVSRLNIDSLQRYRTAMLLEQITKGFVGEFLQRLHDVE